MAESQNYGIPIFCNLLFFITCLEVFPFRLKWMTYCGIQVVLAAVSCGFSYLFFIQSKTYTNYEAEGESVTRFHLWDPSPLSFFFLCFFSPLTMAILFFYCSPSSSITNVFVTESLCFVIGLLIIAVKNKFLEREIEIRKIDAASQDQKDFYNSKYYIQVPKEDYSSKYKPSPKRHTITPVKQYKEVEEKSVSPVRSGYKRPETPIVRKQERYTPPTSSLYKFENNEHDDDDIEMVDVSENVSSINYPSYDDRSRRNDSNPSSSRATFSFIPEKKASSPIREPLPFLPPVKSIEEEFTNNAVEQYQDHFTAALPPIATSKTPPTSSYSSSNLFQKPSSGKKKRRKSTNPFQRR